MQTIVPWTGIAVLSYLLGSIPTGYLLGRARGVDIRRLGSGNIGATNVVRCLGKKMGAVTLTVDFIKGLLPTLLARAWIDSTPHEAAMLAAAMAVIGHVWPVTMRFRGGKGVATAAGGLLGVVPAAMGLALIVWLILFLAIGYVSLASMVAAVCAAVAAWIWYGDYNWIIPAAVSFLAVVTLWRHRGNMLRLINGTESRFRGLRRKAAAP